MAVICVTVCQSAEQIVSGIPRTVSITTNIPATIFYTLDGTTPTLFSIMYTGPIFLPFDQLLVTLSILATNGTDTSPIVIEQYMTDIVNSNARLPHAGTTVQAAHIVPDQYPFGNPGVNVIEQYTNPADAGAYGGAVYDPNDPCAVPNAFDGQGNPTGYSNEPYNTKNYQITYTDRDAEGAQDYGLIGRGVSGAPIGNIPGKVTNVVPTINQETQHYPSDIMPDTGQTGNQGPEQTSQFTNLFDPRAMVIFQDFANENPDDPPMINRQFFTLENPERARDGTFYYNTGQDSTAPPSGSFVRAHYNPRDNTITHYYRDSWSNRWIISTAPYQPQGPAVGGTLAQQVMGFKSGGGVVFEWLPFTRRVLF
jgi:Chitobiase/beta-hexosaminidase C-terminal domain